MAFRLSRGVTFYNRICTHAYSSSTKSGSRITTKFTGGWEFYCTLGYISTWYIPSINNFHTLVQYGSYILVCIHAVPLSPNFNADARCTIHDAWKNATRHTDAHRGTCIVHYKSSIMDSNHECLNLNKFYNFEITKDPTA